MRKKTTEEFIKEAKKVHGDKYDYSSTEYNGALIKVKIRCSIHGEFKQNPSNHLNGQGCPKCGGTIKKTTEDFIREAKLKHGNKFDYSLVEYIDAKTKVKIICSNHGIFEQIAGSHLSGQCCPKCANNIKLTTEEFIERAKAEHGDKFDYSLVEYNDNKTKVKIGCLMHGIFEQKPSNHLSGAGCPKCANNKKLTTEEFIKEARKVHDDKYDYSNTEYNGNKIKVKIGCPIHGIFEQTPDSHLRDRGCPKCCGRDRTTEEFIKEAKAVHGDKFDYSSTKYIDTKTKVKIGCLIHGIFEQTPTAHLHGHGCPKCSGKGKTTEEFIKEAKAVHGDKYDYSLVKYVDSKTKVKIGCSIHGIFKQAPNNHLNGGGCPKCCGRDRTTEEFIKEAKVVHGEKYDYSSTNYKDAIAKVKIRCPIHGEFEQTPNSHLSGNGCSKCNSSKGEIRISNHLSNKEIEFIPQYKFNECKNIRSLPFDFYLPKHNMCIEFDGKQHFEAIERFGGKFGHMKCKKHDEIKNKYCVDNNIKLLRIRHDQMNDIENILDENIVSYK